MLECGDSLHTTDSSLLVLVRSVKNSWYEGQGKVREELLISFLC